jgi:hypothetical protein
LVSFSGRIAASYCVKCPEESKHGSETAILGRASNNVMNVPISGRIVSLESSKVPYAIADRSSELVVCMLVSTVKLRPQVHYQSRRHVVSLLLEIYD